MNKAQLDQPMRGHRFHFLFAISTVLLCTCLSWLIVAENSPCRSYFLWHGDIPNLFRQLHMIPFIVGILVSGNVHQPSPIGYWGTAVLMWFVISFAVSFAFPSRRVPKALR